MIRTLLAQLNYPQCDIEKWYNGTIHQCVFGPPEAVFGELLLGAMGGGVVVMATYVVSNGRLSAASVLTLLLAGILIPRLPGSMVSYAWGIAFVGLVAGLLAIARKYVLNPGI